MIAAPCTLGFFALLAVVGSMVFTLCALLICAARALSALMDALPSTGGIGLDEIDGED